MFGSLEAVSLISWLGAAHFRRRWRTCGPKLNLSSKMTPRILICLTRGISIPLIVSGLGRTVVGWCLWETHIDSVLLGFSLIRHLLAQVRRESTKDWSLSRAVSLLLQEVQARMYRQRREP